ncbi:type I secretion system permease/ATPase, partial [Mesorhizobium sp. M4A.F.Ca.ET.050.02.1.1]
MAIQNENAYAADHGLRALALFLRFHGVDAKPDQIRDRYGDGGAIGIRAMLRCARELGLKVGARKAHWNRLSSVRLPGIASLHDGGFLLLAKADDNGAVVLHPHSSGPKRITRAELEAIWDGRLILAGSQNVAQRALHTLAGMGMRGRDLLRRARDTVMRPRFADRRDTAAEATSTASESDDDSGLIALAILLRCHGIAADPDQIRHRMGAARVGVTEVLRCAKDFGLKAQAQRTKWNRLAVTPLPGIAVLRDGGFLILGKVVDDKLLVQRPSSPQPITMTQADLEAIWDGDIILMTRRAPLTDLSRRFDISWFLGAVHKYRHLLSEVLVASFFLQVFALLSPLFFQVIIDKVLVHRSMSTLDVLVTGLVALTVFETVLGTLRVYLFAHTTNRIDVELGARLF